jgi:hypothetical protein
MSDHDPYKDAARRTVLREVLEQAMQPIARVPPKLGFDNIAVGKSFLTRVPDCTLPEFQQAIEDLKTSLVQKIDLLANVKETSEQLFALNAELRPGSGS